MIAYRDNHLWRILMISQQKHPSRICYSIVFSVHRREWLNLILVFLAIKNIFECLNFNLCIGSKARTSIAKNLQSITPTEHHYWLQTGSSKHHPSIYMYHQVDSKFKEFIDRISRKFTTKTRFGNYNSSISFPAGMLRN